MFNKLRANPGMALGAALFIVALIAVIVWIVRRGGKEKPKGDGEPQIDIAVKRKILHPANKNSTVEEYMEYNTGDVTPSASNISIDVEYTNGGGFNEVTGLKFVRTGPNTDTFEKIIDSADQLTDFASGKVTFSGNEIKTESGYSGWSDPTDFIGTNTFSVYYQKNGTWNAFANTTSEVQISAGDLERTLNLTNVTTVAVVPTQNTQTFLATKTVGQKTLYTIYDYYGSPVKTNTRFNSNSDNTLTLKDELWNDDVLITNVTKYKLEKYLENTYLIYYTNDQSQDIYVTKKDNGSLEGITKATVFSTEKILNASRFQILESKESPTIRTSPSTMSVSRKYPPKPYPGPGNAAGSALNTVTWTVTGADYGNGQYTASIDDSFTGWNPESFDVEGLVDGFFKGETGNLGVYHSGSTERDTTFTLTMPKGIVLDRVELGNRTENLGAGYANPTKYVIKGVKDDASEEVLITTTTATASADYEPWSITIPDDKKNQAYKTFKVIFTTVNLKWSVISNILFYGKENTT